MLIDCCGFGGELITGGVLFKVVLDEEADGTVVVVIVEETI